MVREYLGESGFRVDGARDRRATVSRRSSAEPFDALVLDVMLPDLDGFEVCRRVRADSDVPILMLTARGDETDRIVGLELGADDYLPKPFSPRELLARLRAILRRRRARFRPGARCCASAGSRSTATRASCASTARSGRSRATSSTLLVALAEHAGRVLSRETLMDLVRGESLEAFDRIDRRARLAHPRRRSRTTRSKPRRILTVRGAGYVFARSQDGERARRRPSANRSACASVAAIISSCISRSSRA